jgi:hypothetical protein
VKISQLFFNYTAELTIEKISINYKKKHLKTRTDGQGPNHFDLGNTGPAAVQKRRKRRLESPVVFTAYIQLNNSFNFLLSCRILVSTVSRHGFVV